MTDSSNSPEYTSIQEKSKSIIADIIVKFNEIEQLTKEILSGFIDSKEDYFVSEILFNNLIINFSSKLKALIFIAKFKKLESKVDLKGLNKSLKVIMTKRNIIAHSDKLDEPVYEIIGIDVDYNKDGNFIFPDIQMKMPSAMTVDNGQIVFEDIDKIHEDFNKYYRIGKEELNKLKSALNIKTKSPNF